LNRPEERTEATEGLRALIDKIMLKPGPNRGEIDAMLYGELGTILNWIERQAIDKAAKITLSELDSRECRYRYDNHVPTADA
jgi:site-specific DNA recombinase